MANPVAYLKDLLGKTTNPLVDETSDSNTIKDSMETLNSGEEWKRFILGTDEKGKPLIWNPYESAHLYSFGAHANMITGTIVQHCAYNQDNWLTFVADPQGINVPRTAEMMVNNVEFVDDVEETLAAAEFIYDTVILRTQTALKPQTDSLLQNAHSHKSFLFVLAEPSKILNPTGIKTDEGIMYDEMRGKIKNRLFNIATFGPKVGVHLIIAGDYMKSKDFYQQILEDIETKVILGVEKHDVANQAFGHDYWIRFDMSTRGAGCFQSKQKIVRFQANEYAARKFD